METNNKKTPLSKLKLPKSQEDRLEWLLEHKELPVSIENLMGLERKDVLKLRDIGTGTLTRIYYRVIELGIDLSESSKANWAPDGRSIYSVPARKETSIKVRIDETISRMEELLTYAEREKVRISKTIKELPGIIVEAKAVRDRFYKMCPED